MKKPWQGCPNESEIDVFADAWICSPSTGTKKEARPPGWKFRCSTTEWKNRVGVKGSGAQLNARILTYVQEAKAGWELATAGRLEAVVIGMMLWPDSMRTFIAMSAKERRATLALFGEEINETTHQIALATLYHRIVKRAKKENDREDS